MQIVTAAWERRERDAINDLEAVQASVPYTTLRVIAATTPGAATIDAALRANHAHVWHKLGDNDMPIFDPNPAALTPELGMLQMVEEDGPVYRSNVLVTFGYNLTTANAQGPVREALAEIYTTEMELRDRIASFGVPMYASEPTTFYRPVVAGAMNEPWVTSEREGTGGSGQQLEGAKLAKALKKTTGSHHYTFHQIKVDTAAGVRNDSIVALLNGWWNNGTGDPAHIQPQQLEHEINQLDQSALRDNEYLDKVIGNLGHKLEGNLSQQIARLVTEYRRLAAARACNKVHVPLQWPRTWASDMTHKYAKIGL
jgi:hypothetical protein